MSADDDNSALTFEGGDADDRAEPAPAPAAPEVLEDLPDLEDMPVRELPNIFRCPKGHVQLGPNETKVINRWNQQVDLRSGPICLACYLKWMGQAFKTKDTGVQAEVKLEPLAS